MTKHLKNVGNFETDMRNVHVESVQLKGKLCSKLGKMYKLSNYLVMSIDRM